MRIHEIIAETGDATTPDTWEARFADHQRQQAKRTKLKGKIADAEAAASDQARTAASRRARNGDKIAGLRRELAQPKT